MTRRQEAEQRMLDAIRKASPRTQRMFVRTLFLDQYPRLLRQLRDQEAES